MTPTPILIDDADDPRLQEYRQLRENRLPRPIEGAPHGVFIAEGEKVVRLLLGSGRYRTRSLLLCERRLSLEADVLRAVPPGVPVYVANQAVMDAIVGFPIHRGVLASGVRSAPASAESLLHTARACLIAEATANHDNMGGLFRVAAALGGGHVDGSPACPILLDPTSCDPLYRKAIRVSMGHALRVPWARLSPWPAGLCPLRGAGWTVIALSPGPGSVRIDDLGPVDKPAMLLGAEGPGLNDAALNSVDVRVSIPMSPGVDSLNVVTAAAIALHRLIDPHETANPSPA